MFRTIWFFCQIALVAAAALWLLERPGNVVLQWQDYTVTMQAGLLALGVVLCLLIFAQLIRIVGFLLSIPGFLSARQKEKNRQKGMAALTGGLAAISAGDFKTAARLSARAQKYLPAQALPLFLSAQSAASTGDDGKAEQLYEQLLEDKDAAFFGLRGLIQSALARGDIQEALDRARAALKKHPRQGWILNLVYRLELQRQSWSDAEDILERLHRAKAIEDSVYKSDKIAFLVLKAAGEDVSLLKKAHALDPKSLIATIALAQAYVDQKKSKKAAALIEKIWPENPHPDLVNLWEQTAPSNTAHDTMKRLRWFEKLVALHPDSALGQMAAARAAMNDNLWHEAKAYAAMAETLEPSASLYRLCAEIERQTTHDEAQITRYMELAAGAPASKVWTCTQTGTVYESWSPVAQPHGAFNTIRWTYPGQTGYAARSDVFLPDQSGLFLPERLNPHLNAHESEDKKSA